MKNIAVISSKTIYIIPFRSEQIAAVKIRKSHKKEEIKNGRILLIWYAALFFRNVFYGQLSA